MRVALIITAFASAFAMVAAAPAVRDPPYKCGIVTLRGGIYEVCGPAVSVAPPATVIEFHLAYGAPFSQYCFVGDTLRPECIRRRM